MVQAAAWWGATSKSFRLQRHPTHSTIYADRHGCHLIFLIINKIYIPLWLLRYRWKASASRRVATCDPVVNSASGSGIFGSESRDGASTGSSMDLLFFFPSMHTMEGAVEVGNEEVEGSRVESPHISVV